MIVIFFMFAFLFLNAASKTCSNAMEEQRKLIEEEIDTVPHSSEWYAMIPNQNRDAMWMYGKANDVPVNKTVLRKVDTELATDWYKVYDVEASKYGFTVTPDESRLFFVPPASDLKLYQHNATNGNIISSGQVNGYTFSQGDKLFSDPDSTYVYFTVYNGRRV